MIQKHYPMWPMQRVAALLLTLLLFFVPISSTAKSILIGLLTVTLFMVPIYRRQFLEMFKYNWCIAAFSLFFIVLLACSWSPAGLAEKCLVLEKYSKWLYLPILVVGFQDKKIRFYALHAFLLAMTLTCVLSIIKYMNFFIGNGINQDFVFRNHIMTGIMVSFAAYLSAWFFFDKNVTSPISRLLQASVNSNFYQRVSYLLLYLLFSYQILFINTGRTGYVMYTILMLFLMIQLFKKYQAILGIIVVCFALLISYNQSTIMHDGVSRVINDWQHFQDDKNTSVGYRLQFHDYAKKLFMRHPYIGNGTGSFTYLYAQENPVPSWSRALLEPHSQYWLIAAEQGLLGLVSLLFLIGSLFYAVCRLTTLRPLAFGLLGVFCLGNMSDSLFLYSGSGYFFILLIALCLGESVSFLSGSKATLINHPAPNSTNNEKMTIF